MTAGISSAASTPSPTKQSPVKAKQSRFSPHLPKKPPSSSKKGWNGHYNSRSKYKKGRGSVGTELRIPQEQSHVMEKGEELRVAISRGNVERVKAVMDSGEQPLMRFNL